MEYSIVMVSEKRVERRFEGLGFESEQAARMYAQGVFDCSLMAGKYYGIIMLPGGKYASSGSIFLNVTAKMQEAFHKHLYENGQCYNLYAGYHELYVSRRKLGKPYTPIGTYYSLEAAQEAAEQYDDDAHIIYDRELADEVEEWAELADVEEYAVA